MTKQTQSPETYPCQHVKSKCYDSRTVNGVRWRRRECLVCGEKWTTIEQRVELGSGTRIGMQEALREAVGLNVRQQKAIGELIQAFTDPELEEDDEQFEDW